MCEHSMTQQTHPSCFKSGKPWWADLRIGYLDIEASNLKANFGMILSWHIKKRGQNAFLSDVIDQPHPQAAHDHLDKQQVISLVKALDQFDILVTYYGSLFDIPFIKSRAFHYGLKFPAYGTKVQFDLYFLARGLFALTSRRQNAIAELLFGKSEKTRLDGDLWNHAVRGDKKALRYVFDHNRHDVIELERLHDALKSYIKPTRRSL